MRTNLEDNRAHGLRLGPGTRGRKLSFVPADNAVIDADSPFYIEMNPAGAVDVLMPASSAALAGLMFLMSNISASAITLKTDGDAGFTTAIVLAANEATIVFCTGSTTQAVGWRALATASSA